MLVTVMIATCIAAQGVRLDRAAPAGFAYVADGARVFFGRLVV